MLLGIVHLRLYISTKIVLDREIYHVASIRNIYHRFSQFEAWNFLQDLKLFPISLLHFHRKGKKKTKQNIFQNCKDANTMRDLRLIFHWNE